MNLDQTDRSVLKEVLKEILKEDVSLFKQALREILAEHQSDQPVHQENREEKIKQLLSEDFDTYEEVFKALA